MIDPQQMSVGHATDAQKQTGVTTLWFPQRATASVAMPGGATSTRQFDSLGPAHGVGHIDAICFCGGSAFGLTASAGVLDVLRQRRQGHVIRDQVVPIVPTAALFDLFVGQSEPPTVLDGQTSMIEAIKQTPSPQWGRVGAGTGCAVGKLMGIEHASPAGIGAATVVGADGLQVTAVVAVNAFGDILTHRGEWMAGCALAPVDHLLCDANAALSAPTEGENTTLAAIMVSQALDKPSLARVAAMATQGFAWRIRPVFSGADGDLVVAVSLADIGQPRLADSTLVMRLGQLAAHAVAGAIEHAMEVSR